MAPQQQQQQLHRKIGDVRSESWLDLSSRLVEKPVSSSIGYATGNDTTIATTTDSSKSRRSSTDQHLLIRIRQFNYLSARDSSLDASLQALDYAGKEAATSNATASKPNNENALMLPKKCRHASLEPTSVAPKLRNNYSNALHLKDFRRRDILSSQYAQSPSSSPHCNNPNSNPNHNTSNSKQKSVIKRSISTSLSNKFASQLSKLQHSCKKLIKNYHSQDLLRPNIYEDTQKRAQTSLYPHSNHHLNEQDKNDDNLNEYDELARRLSAASELANSKQPLDKIKIISDWLAKHHSNWPQQLPSQLMHQQQDRDDSDERCASEAAQVDRRFCGELQPSRALQVNCRRQNFESSSSTLVVGGQDSLRPTSSPEDNKNKLSERTSTASLSSTLSLSSFSSLSSPLFSKLSNKQHATVSSAQTTSNNNTMNKKLNNEAVPVERHNCKHNKQQQHQQPAFFVVNSVSNCTVAETPIAPLKASEIKVSSSIKSPSNQIVEVEDDYYYLQAATSSQHSSGKKLQALKWLPETYTDVAADYQDKDDYYQDCINDNNDNIIMNNQDDDYAVPADQDFYLDKSQVELVQLIGEGQRGFVFLGKLQSRDGRQLVDVAIKTLKYETELNVERLISEAALMRQFEHPHIVRFLGVCAETPALIAMELAPFGEVRDYLRTRKHLIHASHLSLFVFQLSTALSYLESKQFVHRDVAARNVLVATPNCIKLADFGLTKSITSTIQHHRHQQQEQQKEACYVAAARGKLPVRWLAPESLAFRHFTSASDAWMFAVCAWELFCFGECRPWAELRNSQVLRALQEGERLSRPAACPTRLYQLLLACWSFTPARRPKFRDLKRELWSIYLRERAADSRHKHQIEQKQHQQHQQHQQLLLQINQRQMHHQTNKFRPSSQDARPVLTSSSASSSTGGSSCVAATKAARGAAASVAVIATPGVASEAAKRRVLAALEQSSRFEWRSAGAACQLQRQRSQGAISSSSVNVDGLIGNKQPFDANRLSDKRKPPLRRPLSVEYRTTSGSGWKNIADDEANAASNEDSEVDDDDKLDSKDVCAHYEQPSDALLPPASQQMQAQLAKLKQRPLRRQVQLAKPLRDLIKPTQTLEMDAVLSFGKLNEIAMIKSATPSPVDDESRQQQHLYHHQHHHRKQHQTKHQHSTYQHHAHRHPSRQNQQPLEQQSVATPTPNKRLSNLLQSLRVSPMKAKLIGTNKWPEQIKPHEAIAVAETYANHQHQNPELQDGRVELRDQVRRREQLELHQRLLGRIRPADGCSGAAGDTSGASKRNSSASQVPSVDQSLKILNSLMADEFNGQMQQLKQRPNRNCRATSLFVERR